MNLDLAQVEQREDNTLDFLVIFFPFIMTLHEYHKRIIFQLCKKNTFTAFILLDLCCR